MVRRCSKNRYRAPRAARAVRQARTHSWDHVCDRDNGQRPAVVCARYRFFEHLRTITHHRVYRLQRLDPSAPIHCRSQGPPTLTALSQTACPDQPRRGTVRKLIKPIFRIAELGRPRLARGRYGDPGPRQAVEETKLSGNTRGVGSIADYLLHPRRLESPLSCRLFPRLHTDRKYHAEGGAVPERRLKDDPPSVHLHNALSNCHAQTSPHSGYSREGCARREEKRDGRGRGRCRVAARPEPHTLST